jgi:hypothetical protein
MMNRAASKVTESLPGNSPDNATMSEALSRLYHATVSSVGEIVDSLSASERSRLAVFCYGRVHLNAIGLAIAARCDLDHLTAAAHSATAGRAIYDQSRNNFPTERPMPGRRVAITLATSVSRSLASRAAFASAETPA